MQTEITTTPSGNGRNVQTITVYNEQGDIERVSSGQYPTLALELEGSGRGHEMHFDRSESCAD